MPPCQASRNPPSSFHATAWTNKLALKLNHMHSHLGSKERKLNHVYMHSLFSFLWSLVTMPLSWWWTRSQCSKSSIWGVSFAQIVKIKVATTKDPTMSATLQIKPQLINIWWRLKARMHFLTFWNQPGEVPRKVYLNFKLIPLCPNHCFYQIRS